MSWCLLKLIEIYWFLFPTSKRRKCIFKETCSKYVYRRTRENGIIYGVKAFIERLNRCKGGYRLFYSKDGIELVLQNGTIVPEGEIAIHILNDFHRKGVNFNL